ncbi:MAG TPA: acetylglutamate kinase [Candidatus Hydrogenedentes bacterium]|jgi:acetylglutamate kinase|nr:acetylglutamate kinase [FCB group bacterium]HNZ16738.1 acetylglutamate kinase [Candidatus Hydrogenedentota bacterium]HOH32183.1 acetylglutamate kinase [Candidatus Hydrogenedentota bacterium]HPA05074.1 acetylglutamate kinase [Candidatus Hydrogenedentota bacterium]HPV36522.1 acetylglutamate kinase [Candidatus Hydrogenedentota bacterium]
MHSQMQEFIQKASILIEALPYIREFDGKTVVIKYGGAAMENATLRKSVAEDITLMKYVGMNPVVVHGGGPEINRRLKQLNVEAAFHNGLRITDEETIRVVEMVLAGTVNKEIVALLNTAGGNSVGICGKDGNLLHARRIELPDGADIGFVGRVTNVKSEIIETLCRAGFIPVVAPLATDREGNTWNINADTAAGEIAASLRAEKLVFMTDTPGLLRDAKDPETLIHRIDRDEIAKLKDLGVIAGGMIPKVDSCLLALDQGVRKTHIIDGRVPHALLLEIFTTQGLGTLVTR